ncbi:MAG: FAD-dependent oxidoreductase [Woeseiaceae bacterium]|nr:FAD-dependent oxidoreductase [Woeseiaceae bacterium]
MNLMVPRDERMKRRDFLAAIGRSVGGTAMLRVMTAIGVGTTVAGCGSSSASGNGGNAPNPPPPPGPSGIVSPRPGDWPAGVGTGRSVVILGAGIAGMTTALEMTRLGYDCTLLEATPRAGGRNRTIRSADIVAETDATQVCQFDPDDTLYFNPGPARIPHHHEFLLGYCREFGVALEPFINDNRAALLHSPSGFGGVPQVARRVRTDTRGYIAELLATAINGNALDQELTAADRANVLAMLRQFGDLGGGDAYAGSSRAGFPGQENTGSRNRGQLLAPLPLADLVREAFWQQRVSFAEDFEQQATMLQPVGGMDRIAAAFESQVLADITYEAVVSEIRKTAGGARVVYSVRGGAAQSLDADYCVCTIPATVLRNIATDFSASHASAIANFVYTPAAKLAFQSRRFWEQDHNIYGGISWTTQDMTQMWYPNSNFGAANGIVVGSYIFGGAAGTRFAARTPQQRIDTTMAQAASLHPALTGEATRGISVAWSKVPFQLGAWGTSTPGVLLDADDSLFLAGEHLSILQGWQEGAILSAYHAIDGIVTRDSA